MLKNKSKQIWLLVFVVLVVLMIGVGGVTRLTRSGLSIVEWKPVSGFIPPLSQEDWQAQFDLYKTSPEYQQVNSQFSLADYQRIFIWEYLHRVLGRLIFLWALIPGWILWRKKQLEAKVLVALPALVAAQGLVGWLMVKSGLKQEPQVSPFMLTLHFFSALFVLLYAYYHLAGTRPPLLVSGITRFQRRLLAALGGLIFWQIFFGCLTSGWKAGFSFNTFPLMGGEFFPPGGMRQEPAWVNFLMNPAMIQWIHRWLGIFLLVFVGGIVVHFYKSDLKPVLKGPLMHLFGVVLSQVVLGVLNILYVVPISGAVAHQLIGTMLVMSYMSIMVRLKTQ